MPIDQHPAPQGLPFDPIRESCAPGALVAIVFNQSPSQSYPMAVELARGAAKYTERPMGSRLIHVAVFTEGQEQAARAAAVLRIVTGWKGTQAFTTGGMAAHPYAIGCVLECYLTSLAVADYRAHCHWVCSGYGETDHVVPCRNLQGWFEGMAASQHQHPSKLEDQVQAMAVRKGCAWCPRFRARDVKSLPSRS